MRVFGILGTTRKTFKHRRSPGVAAEKPVAMRDHRIVKLLVSGHQLVEVYLRYECDDKIIRAPKEWNSDAPRIGLRACDDSLDPAEIITGEFALCFRIDEWIQSEVADVRERIHL